MPDTVVIYDVFAEANSEIHVAGVTFHTDVVRKLAGQRLLYTLRRDPANQVDRNAVAVWSPIGQVGFVHADVAPMYGHLLESAQGAGFNLAFWGTSEPWNDSCYVSLEVPKFTVIRDVDKKPLASDMFTRLSVTIPSRTGSKIGLGVFLIALGIVAVIAVVLILSSTSG